MKEMGYKAKVVDGYVICQPSKSSSKAKTLSPKERGTGKPMGSISLEEFRMMLLK